MNVYSIPDADGKSICAVVCDDEKEATFRDAARLMQEALDLPRATKAVVRQDRTLDETEGWSADFIEALRKIDEADGSVCVYVCVYVCVCMYVCTCMYLG